jgi:hypothetical protein
MLSSMGGALCISGWFVQASGCELRLHVCTASDLVSRCSLSVTRASCHPTQRLPERPGGGKNPASYGTVACDVAISSITDTVLSDLKTGFTV